MSVSIPSSERPEDNPRRPRRPLEAVECRAVIEAFGLRAVRGVRDFNAGNPASPKALVETDAGRFLLKRRAPGLDDRDQIQIQHAAQAALHHAGRPVPAPVATRKGETIAVHDGRVYELYPFIDAAPWAPGFATSRAAGAVLADMHETLDQMACPGCQGSDHHDRVARAFAHLGSSGSGFCRSLERLGHDWDSALRHRGHLESPPARLTHGDYHPANTLWRGRSVAAVLDFETMRLAPLVEEVALAALYFALDTTGADPNAWPAAPDTARIEAFWGGYRANDRFDPEVVEVVPWIMIEGIIAEALPRACRSDGFRRQDRSEILRFIARTVAWISDHANGLSAVLLQADH